MLTCFKGQNKTGIIYHGLWGSSLRNWAHVQLHMHETRGLPTQTPIFFVVRYSTFALSCGSDSIDLSRLQYIQSLFSSTLWCKSIYLFLGAYVCSMWYPKEEKDFDLNSIVLYLLHNQRVKVTRDIIKQINYASFLNLFIGHQN